MKLEDVEAKKICQWNGKLFYLGTELEPRLAQTVTVNEIDADDEELPIHAEGSRPDPTGEPTDDYWLRPEDLSPLPEEDS